MTVSLTPWQVHLNSLRMDLPEHFNATPHQIPSNLTVNLPPSPTASSRPFTISNVVARDEQPPAYKDVYNDGLPSYHDVLRSSQLAVTVPRQSTSGSVTVRYSSSSHEYEGSGLYD